MTAFVDQVGKYPDGTYARLVADTWYELHALATKAGLQAEQFCEYTVRPHYRITAEQRKQLVDDRLAMPVQFVYGCTTGTA